VTKNRARGFQRTRFIQGGGKKEVGETRVQSDRGGGERAAWEHVEGKTKKVPRSQFEFKRKRKTNKRGIHHPRSSKGHPTEPNLVVVGNKVFAQAVKNTTAGWVNTARGRRWGGLEHSTTTTVIVFGCGTGVGGGTKNVTEQAQLQKKPWERQGRGVGNCVKGAGCWAHPFQAMEGMGPYQKNVS